MKAILYLLAVVCLSAACNQPDKILLERISLADSVAINFFKGDGTMDTVVAVKIIRDKAVIGQLASFIAAESTRNEASCGYDGSMHFFRKNMVVQDIDFSTHDENCMYFSFLLHGSPQTTILSAGAKLLITSLTPQNRR